MKKSRKEELKGKLRKGGREVGRMEDKEISQS